MVNGAAKQCTNALKYATKSAKNVIIYAPRNRVISKELTFAITSLRNPKIILQSSRECVYNFKI